MVSALAKPTRCAVVAVEATGDEDVSALDLDELGHRHADPAANSEVSFELLPSGHVPFVPASVRELGDGELAVVGQHGRFRAGAPEGRAGVHEVADGLGVGVAVTEAAVPNCASTPCFGAPSIFAADLSWRAERIFEWQSGGLDVYAYFNNDGEVHAGVMPRPSAGGSSSRATN
jgi:hypothetical protein